MFYKPKKWGFLRHAEFAEKGQENLKPVQISQVLGWRNWSAVTD